jgi:hypothetical protein
VAKKNKRQVWVHKDFVRFKNDVERKTGFEIKWPDFTLKVSEMAREMDFYRWLRKGKR